MKNNEKEKNRSKGAENMDGGNAGQQEKKTVSEKETRKETAEKAEKPAEKTPEERIEELEKSVAELEDKRLRLIAEMDNLRKRSSKDMETLRYSVMTDTLYPFFQVFDHFSMAVAASAASDNIQALNEGMKMIRNEFDRAFSDLGIEKIDAVGKEFDPNTQEAVSQEASENVPSGIVLRQWCSGYRMRDRVLKPASVVVSSGPEKKEENGDSK